MKLLTTNFIKCSVKACDSSSNSFPLKYDNNSQLELNYEDDDEVVASSYEFLVGILDKIEWDALLQVCRDLGNNDLPPNKPVINEDVSNLDDTEKLILKQLFNLLVNTEIVEGSMTCDSCKHTYQIKNGIPNLLLPPHLS